MTTYSGLSPVNSASLGTTFADKGLLVKRNGANIEITTGKADVAIAVTIDESSRDAAGNLDAAADATVSVVGLDGVQLIKCKGGGALTIGESLYVHEPTSAAENGWVHTTSTGAKFVGYYMGESITPAAGDLIPVLCRNVVA